MCLAVPGKVIKVDGSRVLVDLLGNRLWARADLVAGIQPGDYVLIHAGIVLARIDAAAAQETFTLLEELAHHDGS